MTRLLPFALRTILRSDRAPAPHPALVIGLPHVPAHALRLALSLAALLMMALALPSPAAAQAPRASSTDPWERVGQYEGRTLYFDPTTLRKSGSRVQTFVLTDLKEPNATARGRQYLSKKALLEFDCSQRTMRVLQDTWYPRRMAAGEPVFLTEGAAVGAFPVQADSPGDMLFKAACGRR